MTAHAPPLNLLLLRFSRFYTNSPDFKDRFGRYSVPSPDPLLDVFPDRIPGITICFPAQADLQKVADFLLGKHQEGVRQVQTNNVIMAAQRRSQVKTKHRNSRSSVSTLV